MSGLTLVNETLPAVIRRTPSARIRVLLGPTVPPSPVLFECGIDLLGVTLVDDWKAMARYAELGGGSIARAPPGALERINLVRDRATFQQTLGSLSGPAGRGEERRCG